MMIYPDRRALVAQYGFPSAGLDAAWQAALDDYWQAMPIVPPAIKSWPDLPAGTRAEMHGGIIRLRGWDPSIHPPREQIESESAAWAAAKAIEDEAARSRVRTRRQALLALRDSSGAMTAAQLTIALRLLAREILGDQ